VESGVVILLGDTPARFSVGSHPVLEHCKKSKAGLFLFSLQSARSNDTVITNFHAQKQADAVTRCPRKIETHITVASFEHPADRPLLIFPLSGREEERAYILLMRPKIIHLQ
jgi:hypothetical protein